MAKHKFTAADKENLAKSKDELTKVRNRIETDAGALNWVDTIIDEINDLMDQVGDA